MRVVLYARVSTRDKDQTTETQLRILRAEAEHFKWEVAEVYQDTASASDMRGRVQWASLLERVRKHNIDAVIVTKLDRAFRSSKDTYDALEYFERHKVGFISTTQPIDTTTPAGKLTLGVLAAVAEFEKDMITERVNEGMARAREEGKHLGRPRGSKDKKKRSRRGYLIRYAE